MTSCIALICLPEALIKAEIYVYLVSQKMMIYGLPPFSQIGIPVMYLDLLGFVSTVKLVYMLAICQVFLCILLNFVNLFQIVIVKFRCLSRSIIILSASNLSP